MYVPRNAAGTTYFQIARGLRPRNWAAPARTTAARTAPSINQTTIPLRSIQSPFQTVVAVSVSSSCVIAAIRSGQNPGAIRSRPSGAQKPSNSGIVFVLGCVIRVVPARCRNVNESAVGQSTLVANPTRPATSARLQKPLRALLRFARRGGVLGLHAAAAGDANPMGDRSMTMSQNPATPCTDDYHGRPPDFPIVRLFTGRRIRDVP